MYKNYTENFKNICNWIVRIVTKPGIYLPMLKKKQDIKSHWRSISIMKIIK